VQQPAEGSLVQVDGKFRLDPLLQIVDWPGQLAGAELSGADNE
jgi:hypothetical protein